MEILVSRQPVFDRSEQLYGYDLVLRHSSDRDQPEIPPEQLVADTFLGIGIDQVSAGHRAFVTLDRGMVVGGAARVLPADRVVLQLDDSVGIDPELIQACEQLVWSGYHLSISSQHPESLPLELLRLAEIVKVDLSSTDRSRLPELSAWLRTHDVRLLAMHVQHRVERDQCAQLGFELFEGYRFSSPETLTRRDIPIEHMNTFRLLKMVRDPRTVDIEVEDVLRRDVALSYKLLRMVNSAAVGGRDIWSIGHALRLLGRDQVARWLGLLLVTDGSREGVRAELMSLALVRSRMCELLADESGVPRARGPLFLIGMLSVLDQLLEIPMQTLIDSIELAPDLRSALLTREDYFGSVLALVEAYEMGRWSRVESIGGSIGVSSSALAPLYLKSLAWATEHARNRDDSSPPKAVPQPAPAPAQQPARAAAGGRGWVR